MDDTQRQSDRYPVLTLELCAVTMNETVATIASWIGRRERRYLNLCTTHTALEGYDSPALSRIINASDLCVPDGMPMVWLGRWRRRRVERIYGPDLMLALCDYGQALGYRHYFYGSTPEVLTRLAAALSRRFPKLNIVGQFSPPFRELGDDEKDEVACMINEAGPDIVWVGLGTPKQDYWMGEFRDRLQAPVLIPVGAAFAFHAGAVSQAPGWMMRAGLEWLYRLLMEPRRLWRRYLIGNPRFVWLAARQWFGRRRTAAK